MRDYLKRGYGVNTLAIRSYIEQKPITRITRDGRNLGQWRRPKSEKRMTVELMEPFVWPEEPKDLSPYVHLGNSFHITFYVLGIHFGRLANNCISFETDGRKNLGTRRPNTKRRRRRRIAKRETLPRSRIMNCARHTRSKPKNLRKINPNGAQHGRLWAWTLRTRSSEKAVLVAHLSLSIWEEVAARVCDDLIYGYRVIFHCIGFQKPIRPWVEAPGDHVFLHRPFLILYYIVGILDEFSRNLGTTSYSLASLLNPSHAYIPSCLYSNVLPHVPPCTLLRMFEYI